ncbi:MAG: hypothetical protein K6E60_02740 [Saccharofermentans sp.]|nr:hypothetical protein [Saccharofermentans sp.]
MNKKILAILMASCTMLSLAACNTGKNVPASSVTTPAPETTSVSETETTVPVTEETTTSEETEETTTAETSEETAETSETTSATTKEKAATPTPKPIGKTTVTNAYSRSFKVGKDKFTTKYPKVTIKGVSTSAINKEIANKFGPIAKKNDSVVKYSYYVGKKYVSIFVTVNLDAGKDGNNYYVYNVSRVTGKKMNKAEMLKMLSIKDSSFKSKVASGIKKWWTTNVPDYKKNKSSKDMYNKAVASKSINSAVPFVNSKGKKCFLLRQMKAPTQAGINDIYATI